MCDAAINLMDKKFVHGNLGQYSLVLLWDLQNLLIISLGDQIHSASVDLAEIQSQAKIIEMSPNDYVSKMFEIMELPQRENYLSLTPTGDNDIKLTWSKELRKGIKVILGIFNLHGCTNLIDFVREFTNLIFNHITNLTSLNIQLQKDNTLLQQVTNSTLKKYDEILTNQEKREQSIFSKFAAVLNEKKRKIANLKSENSIEFDQVGTTAESKSNLDANSCTNKSNGSDNKDDDDNDLLLPEISRTSRSILNRSYAVRKSARMTKDEPLKINEPPTASCSEPDVSVENLINSL